jgi:hypothetical protein
MGTLELRRSDQAFERAMAMRDLLRDWRRWSRRERAISITLAVCAGLLVAAALLIEPRLI